MVDDLQSSYDFIFDRFNDEEVEELSFRYFPLASREFTRGMTLGQKIRVILDYCRRRDQIPQLLQVLQEERPAQFQSHFFPEPADGLNVDERNVFLVATRSGFSTADISKAINIPLSQVIPVFAARDHSEPKTGYSLHGPEYCIYFGWMKLVDIGQPLGSLLKGVKSPLSVTPFPDYELLRAANKMQKLALVIPDLQFLMPRIPPTKNKIARLKYEYNTLLDLTTLSERFSLIENNDPSHFRLKLICRGIQSVTSSGRPVFAEVHEVEIALSEDFPQKAPRVSITSGAYHPNIFSNGSVAFQTWCDWSPSMSIASLCLMTFEMLTYHWFNAPSAANSAAGKWARTSRQRFPLDSPNLLVSPEFFG